MEGKTSIKRRIPEALTTWSVTGFSLDPVHGLGLSKSPKVLEIKKSFVVKVDLPRSIHKGEILAVPVVIRNNLERDINVDVVLHNQEQNFEFAEISNNINDTKSTRVVNLTT